MKVVLRFPRSAVVLLVDAGFSVSQKLRVELYEEIANQLSRRIDAFVDVGIAQIGGSTANGDAKHATNHVTEEECTLFGMVTHVGQQRVENPRDVVALSFFFSEFFGIESSGDVLSDELDGILLRIHLRITRNLDRYAKKLLHLKRVVG